MPMIEVRNLRKSYGNQVVLRDVSFSVDKGEVVVVLGPSGSGSRPNASKYASTCLRDRRRGDPHRPEDPIGYQEDAHGVRRRRKEAQNARLREQVGMVFQSFNLFPHRTVLENVMMGPLKVQGKSARPSSRLRASCSRRSA